VGTKEMTNAIYNEIEPFAASWLEQLIAAGHIAAGAVDRRSIADLTPADVAGPGQRHFFAGIGGWSYALRLAGVPDDADVWTGSCPCQPFSQAGRRSGTDDPRHLWPAWFALIRERRPSVVFGEQVAGPDGLAWLDGVFADLEGCGYACGAAVVSAGGVSAPHARHRLYFVAHADEAGRGADVGMADGVRNGLEGSGTGRAATRAAVDASARSGSRGSRVAGRLGDADGLAGGRNGRAIPRAQGADTIMRRGADGSRPSGVDMDPWRDAIWIDCSDGKRRPIPTEPTLFPLAHGVPNRVGLLRGSGNAIVPQVAATFIRAALEV
jgi:DNA (cytosine-5)-methyltransferase 1